eukprot:2525878-Amphidinium_carterae.1
MQQTQIHAHANTNEACGGRDGVGQKLAVLEGLNHLCRTWFSTQKGDLAQVLARMPPVFEALLEEELRTILDVKQDSDLVK